MPSGMKCYSDIRKNTADGIECGNPTMRRRTSQTARERDGQIECRTIDVFLFFPSVFPLDFHFRSCVISRNIICHFNMSVSQRSLHIIIFFIHIPPLVCLFLLYGRMYRVLHNFDHSFPVCGGTTHRLDCVGWRYAVAIAPMCECVCEFVSVFPNNSSFDKCVWVCEFHFVSCVLCWPVKRQYIIIWRVSDSKTSINAIGGTRVGQKGNQEPNQMNELM